MVLTFSPSFTFFFGYMHLRWFIKCIVSKDEKCQEFINSNFRLIFILISYLHTFDVLTIFNIPYFFIIAVILNFH